MSACPKHAPEQCACWSSVDFPAEAIESVVQAMYGAEEWDVRLAILELAKASGFSPRQANLCAEHALLLMRRDAWYADVGLSRASH